WSKDAFADCDRVARKDGEAAAFPFGDPFPVYLDHLVVPAVAVAPDADPVGRRDAGVAAGHRDRLEQIHSTGGAFRHFIAAGAIDLAEDGEPPTGVPDERDVDLGIDEIIAAVKLRQAGDGLGE